MTSIHTFDVPSLRLAGILLARGDDDSWHDLLELLRQLEADCSPNWRTLAMATLETLVARGACEALGRDPWSAVAPLITELLHGFARHIPADVGRGVKAIEALFDQLASMEPITWPDQLPGAIAALLEAWSGEHAHLVAALARTLDPARLGELLACRRTTRGELRVLRRVAGDLRFIGVIDSALGSSSTLSSAA